MITFDENIKSGIYNYNLFDDNLVGIPILKQNEVVLEVKYNEDIPINIMNVLNTIPMIRQAISKFAMCRSLK
jgi:hypothetical protein